MQPISNMLARGANMVCGGNIDIAEIAFYDFILGKGVKKRIDAFNLILKEIGIQAALEMEDDKYIWTSNVDEEIDIAEELFMDVTELFDYDDLEDYLDDDDGITYVLNEYDRVIHEHKQRKITLGWLREFQDN